MKAWLCEHDHKDCNSKTRSHFEEESVKDSGSSRFRIQDSGSSGPRIQDFVEDKAKGETPKRFSLKKRSQKISQGQNQDQDPCEDENETIKINAMWKKENGAVASAWLKRHVENIKKP